MLTVGLTGGIGSGKSTVSARLARRGAVVIDADALTREVQRRGGAAFDAIVERFGPEVVGPDGELDRPAVAKIVFNDKAALKDLERIVHPAVGRLMAERLAAVAETDDVVVLDVPLMVESGREGHAGLIVVDCPEDVAVARLVEHRGFTEADARARIAAQVSREDRLAKADYVVDNAGSLEDLERQMDDLWAWIEGLRDRGEPAAG